jgi:hypothetical protein
VAHSGTYTGLPYFEIVFDTVAPRRCQVRRRSAEAASASSALSESSTDDRRPISLACAGFAGSPAIR